MPEQPQFLSPAAMAMRVPVVLVLEPGVGLLVGVSMQTALVLEWLEMASRLRAAGL